MNRPSLLRCPWQGPSRGTGSGSVEKTGASSRMSTSVSTGRSRVLRPEAQAIRRGLACSAIHAGGMVMTQRVPAAFALIVAAGALLGAQQQQPQPQGQDTQSFRFRTGVELVNVTATVTDASGRFVAGLTKDDFR